MAETAPSACASPDFPRTSLTCCASSNRRINARLVPSAMNRGCTPRTVGRPVDARGWVRPSLAAPTSPHDEAGTASPAPLERRRQFSASSSTATDASVSRARQEKLLVHLRGHQRVNELIVRISPVRGRRRHGTIALHRRRRALVQFRLPWRILTARVVRQGLPVARRRHHLPEFRSVRRLLHVDAAQNLVHVQGEVPLATVSVRPLRWRSIRIRAILGENTFQQSFLALDLELVDGTPEPRVLVQDVIHLRPVPPSQAHRRRGACPRFAVVQIPIHTTGSTALVQRKWHLPLGGRWHLTELASLCGQPPWLRHFRRPPPSQAGSRCPRSRCRCLGAEDPLESRDGRQSSSTTTHLCALTHLCCSPRAPRCHPPSRKRRGEPRCPFYAPAGPLLTENPGKSPEDSLSRPACGLTTSLNPARPRARRRRRRRDFHNGRLRNLGLTVAKDAERGRDAPLHVVRFNDFRLQVGFHRLPESPTRDTEARVAVSRRFRMERIS
eukprot:scaffold2036_cov256-Pinguiococcus_pyrenoidosus.AAC.12